MSMTPEEQVQRMYRYANALVRMQESGYLTREKIGDRLHSWKPFVGRYLCRYHFRY